MDTSLITLILGLPIAFAILALVKRLVRKYKKKLIFTFWTIASIIIWFICFFINSKFYVEEGNSDLNFWQIMIILDLSVYFIFMICLLFTRKSNRYFSD